MILKTYIAYKSEKECYRIKADDYQVHEGMHKLFENDYLNGTFPVSDGWVIMLDEFISDESQIVEVVSDYMKYRDNLDPLEIQEFTEEELIKMWWNER